MKSCRTSLHRLLFITLSSSSSTLLAFAWAPPSVALLGLHPLGPRCRSRAHSSDITRLLLSSSTTDDDTPDYTGKTLYQRVFYRFSPGSDVDVHDSIVVEERVRFTADPANAGYMVPTGHRTLILRDGRVEDGEIGDDFFTLTVDHDQERTHTGAGNNLELEADICTALYLASNPSLCTTGSVLQVACGSGVASLLGCIGARFVNQNSADSSSSSSSSHDIEQDILTISKEKDGLLPDDLKLLTLTDSNEEDLNEAFHNCKHSGVAASKVAVEPLEWKARNTRRGGPRPKEYKTVVASDVTFSYPEAKELARTVANRLEPSAWYLQSSSSAANDDSSSAAENTGVPRFVHVCPDARDDVTYLHRILQQGYKMVVATGYLKLEKLQFVTQTLPESEPESALDDVELELQQFKEINYQALIAQHDPNYAGEGSGELFFPMETGEYEARSGSTYLEPDAGGSPW